LNEENANYFYDVFGEDTVAIVEAEQAMTYGEGPANHAIVETQSNHETESSNTIYYIVADVVAIAVGFIFILRKRRSAKS
jgi:hypothetical protein